MNRLRVGLLLAAGCVCAHARAGGPLEVQVWPGDAPGSEGATETPVWQERGTGGVIDRAVRQIHRPTIAVFLPAAGTGGLRPAVLIVPGGGFEHLAIDKEGWDVARWLASRGLVGVVVSYRLPKTPGHSYTVATAEADVLQAETVIRARSAEWGIDPARIGILGFSVGGDLAAMAATRPLPESRPAFVGLLYAHPLPEDAGAALENPAPAFIAQAADDTHSRDNSLRLFTWFRANKGAAELHVFSSGGEGYGLGKPGTPVAEWPRLFAAWLDAHGFSAPSRVPDGGPAEADAAASVAPAQPQPSSLPSLIRSIWNSDRPQPASSSHGRGYVNPQGGSPD